MAHIFNGRPLTGLGMGKALTCSLTSTSQSACLASIASSICTKTKVRSVPKGC